MKTTPEQDRFRADLAEASRFIHYVHPRIGIPPDPCVLFMGLDSESFERAIIGGQPGPVTRVRTSSTLAEVTCPKCRENARQYLERHLALKREDARDIEEDIAQISTTLGELP